MKTTAQKWRNSLAVRLPKAVTDQVGVKAKDTLGIEIIDGSIVLVPRLHRQYRVEDLVECITRDNLHDEVDFGGRAGVR